MRRPPGSAPRPTRLLLAAVVFLPSTLFAAATESSVPDLLMVVAAMLAAGKVLAELAERVGLPGVLGELVAGALLSVHVLGVVPGPGAPNADAVSLLAELGVILLLFEVGLETDLKEMIRVGPAATAVAMVGVALPFLFGWYYWAHVPHAFADRPDLWTVGVFVGATLTATSVGITARVLGDLGRMETPEARIVLGAAVIDDVLGLVILSVVSGIAAGGTVSLFGVTTTLAVAVGFLVAAVVVGSLLMPRLADRVARMRARRTLVVLSLAFALGLAALAAKVGSALIIGAFAAGLVLRATEHRHKIEEQIQPIAAVLAPIFFVNVGAAADVSLLDPGRPGSGALLSVAGTLVLLAILGKVAAGWAAPWMRYHRLTVGVGMVPRGEVGLIFADIGRRAGLLSSEVFSAILLMVMATTFLAPVALKLIFARVPPTGPPPENAA
jgi:Kef-type K+ transport system membrane component KefB